MSRQYKLNKYLIRVGTELNGVFIILCTSEIVNRRHVCTCERVPVRARVCAQRMEFYGLLQRHKEFVPSTASQIQIPLKDCLSDPSS